MAKIENSGIVIGKYDVLSFPVAINIFLGESP
jgi:hypothetical protein